MQEMIDAWDYLVDTSIATEEELRLVTNINGMSISTINDVIHARTGYHSLAQLKEAHDHDN